MGVLEASKEKLHSLVDSAVETVEAETTPNSQAGVALLVIEVKDDNGVTAFYTVCTDGREWIQRAALDEAKMAIEFSEMGIADGD